jgi:RHS repeat-associated protein
VLLTKYYAFGDYEKEVTPTGTRHLHYISGGDGLAAIYVKYSNATDSLYFIMTDHIGSIVGAINSTTGTIYRQNFDAWGRKRNPVTWSYTNIPDFPFDRGYTGHEHLKWFGLINMNGRMYDAALCRFLSPDSFVQMPDYSQSFNRYSYCLNNPLIYSDPSGEFILPAIMLGAFIYTGIQGATGNLHSMGDFFLAVGIGGLSGATGYGAGALVGGALSTATTFGGAVINGATVGAAGGFAGGFVGGAGNAWASGSNFSQGLQAGLVGGGYGALGGALIGGISGGIQYQRQISVFQKGCMDLGVNGGDPVAATDQFLSDAQKAWYKDAPMNNVKTFTVENVPVKAQEAMDAIGAPGSTVTSSYVTTGKLTGMSNVYFNKNLAFSSAKQLFFTMGHEFVHVSQFAALAGQPASLIRNPDFMNMLDFHAYSYQNSIGGLQLNSFEKGEILRWSSTYSQFNSMNYINFPWSFNYSFVYPF